MLATELPPTAADWPEATTAVEERGLGWMSFHWLRFNSKLSDFVTGHDAAGIRWCPDFGSWPLDSATCGE
ncbi:MAG TPA: hypothetical protein VMS65_13785 [Polyangiaceae bacterium]|nr:hypothetical protein [Polyangiaceae bacterium]